ncbi:sulfite exporter TauE/SafE family protein [Actinoplanes sp. NPDC023714]|uniref:sulfite exporter TauE/SafE family protein n=1 Tax=Actinoplanes sp. NPDC023714 TaxID=3154322 RepID=UPI003411D62E
MVGTFIGAVGVGGVGLPPALTWFAGLDPHTAAGSSSFSFLFTGLTGTLMYARHRVMPWRLAGGLTLGAALAAMPGALANNLLPDRVVLPLRGVFVTAAGLYHLRSRTRRPRPLPPQAEPRPAAEPPPRAAALSSRAAVLTGAAVGFCSVLTGTSGPVFLIPVLLVLGVPVVEAVAAGQVTQLPLVTLAAAGYVLQGSVDLGLGCVIGVLAVAGARIALRLRPAQLQRR